MRKTFLILFILPFGNCSNGYTLKKSFNIPKKVLLGLMFSVLVLVWGRLSQLDKLAFSDHKNTQLCYWPQITFFFTCLSFFFTAKMWVHKCGSNGKKFTSQQQQCNSTDAETLLPEARESGQGPKATCDHRQRGPLQDCNHHLFVFYHMSSKRYLLSLMLHGENHLHFFTQNEWQINIEVALQGKSAKVEE